MNVLLYLVLEVFDVGARLVVGPSDNLLFIDRVLILPES